MTNARKQQIAREIGARIQVLRNALQEALASGVSSASISGAGNSQSYTRMSVADIRAEIARLERERCAVLAGSSRRRTSPDFDA